MVGYSRARRGSWKRMGMRLEYVLEDVNGLDDEIAWVSGRRNDGGRTCALMIPQIMSFPWSFYEAPPLWR